MHPDDRLADELAQSASALRSLAGDLIGRQQGADADDLVQETMLRAWRSPPPERRGLRPWLSSILRNLASNHRRDDRRRRAREQEHDAARAAAAGGHTTEPETLRAVTEALWQLPEPYQHALTLRYFAGRTPTEIAEQTGSPLPTVKSRLRRGLQMLRERLERERGSDWRAALCAATGLPMAGIAAATTASVLLMAHTTKILLGTAAAAVATWLLWPAEIPSLPPAHAASDGEVRASSGDLVSDAPSVPVERQDAAASDGQAAVDLTHAFSYELRCRVLDRDGLLVANANVAIAPAGGQLNHWIEATGDDGEVTVSWRAHVSSMTVQVGLEVQQTAEGLRRIQVHAGADNEVALLHAHGGSSNLCQAARDSSSQNCTACHTAGTGGLKIFDTALAATVDLHPFGRFRDALLDDTGKRRPDFVMPPGPNLILSIPPPSPPPPQPKATTIEGTVHDAAGTPVAGATVVWGHHKDLPVGRTRTDKSGFYRFDHIMPGEVEVRAGGGSDGIARHRTQVVAESRQSLDFYLSAERTLDGTVILPEGKTADGWRVEYAATDACWIDGAVLRGNTFRLANLPSQKGTLLLWSPQGRLPVAHRADALPAAGVTFDLTMQGLPEGSLQLSIPADDLRRHDLSASIYQAATGRGAAMIRDDETFLLGDLAPGRYRVRLFGPQIGILDLGEHFVDGVTATDLGRQDLPEPALLRIERPDDHGRLELYQRRPELDVLAAPVRTGQFEFLLPAGEWLIMWGDPEAPRWRSIQVGAEPAEVSLR